MTMFRHPMEEKVFKIYNADGQLVDRDMTTQRPFDFESIHIFKIQKAQIHDIEAMESPCHSIQRMDGAISGDRKYGRKRQKA